MTIIETDFEGLVEIHPRIFRDDRGYFLETYREDSLTNYGLPTNFIQDNQSFSTKGVVRGMHLQLAHYGQIKLVRAVTGKVMDIVLDVRKGSKTFGKYYRCLLDSKLGNMLYVPSGFAHGIAVLEDAVFSYKCSEYYHQPSEAGIVYNDPELNIDWGIQNPIISDKDRKLPTFKEFSENYELV